MNTNNFDTQLANRMELLEQRLMHSEHRYRRAERRFRILGGTAFAVLLGSILIVPGNRAAIAQGYGVTLQSLAAQVNALQVNVVSLQNRDTALETKTQYMAASTAGQWTTFTGCNLFIRNGLGATNGNPANGLSQTDTITNGLGNLIIGYNEPGNSAGDNRSGSHNLVIGDCSNYTSYGGIVSGFDNAIAADYATITGGAQNVASGAMSSITAGLSNVASGTQSSCTGGGQNVASGNVSTVSGGVDNVASGYVSAISGGLFVTESNQFGWAAGSYHSP